MLQRQRSDAERTELPGFEAVEGLAEIENAGVFVEVGQAFGIHRAVDWNHQALAPAQVQQTLSMIGVVMGLENAVETARREPFAQVRQAAVDQPALIATLDQRAAGSTLQARIETGRCASHTFAAVDRDLSGVAGAQQRQAHAAWPSMQASMRSTVCSSAPELSNTCSVGSLSASTR
ncbi:hypothetical protein D3C81_1580670 [compost metagenome]